MTAWDKARCIGKTELFFSEKPDDQQQAKDICAFCPIIKACLTHALEHQEAWGVWAGQDYRELRATAVALGYEPPNRRAIPHGTEAGYAWHRRQKLKEPNHEYCEPCIDAYNALARVRVAKYRKRKATLDDYPDSN